MTQLSYIPQTAKLRAEQVESWAHVAGYSSHDEKRSKISGHHSANAVFEAVSEEEKPAILAAWKRGYRNGAMTRGQN